MNILRGQLKASLSATPKGSHVVLSLLVIAMIMCLVAGCLLIWLDKTYLPAFVFAGILLAVIGILWYLSHRDIDSPSYHPTNIVSTDGTNLTAIFTDNNNIQTPEVLQGLVAVLSMSLHRTPLPEPDGLVDENGRPVPQSEEEALERVKSANQRARELLEQAFSRLRALEKQYEVLDQTIPDGDQSPAAGTRDDEDGSSV